MPTVAELLARVPLFQGLDPAERTRIAAIAEPRTLSSEEPLFREGDSGDALWVLLDGSVEVMKRDASGRHQLLATVSAPSVLGEASLLLEDGPRSASALALTDLSLLRMPGAAFRRLLDLQDLAALKLTVALARVLALRLVSMNERLLEMHSGTPRPDALAEFQKTLGAWQF
ncbi:MAG TPA: cyclic nucleotide-binding domain-containing protein [Myxococcaceae bacterium]|nr:cyclic nucleotide-binding domain-containing protein [Myxococcaceae bacterium]